MNIMYQFDEAYQSDDEDWGKKSDRLINTYEKADMATKEVIDDIFITLCGWQFKTLLEGGERE